MVKKIKDLCASRGIRIANLEKILGFANGSLAKSDEKIQAGRLLAVAKYFGVTMEYLMGEDDSDLTQEELTLLDYWRKLDTDQREAVGTLMNTFISQKRESDLEHKGA